MDKIIGFFNAIVKIWYIIFPQKKVEVPEAIVDQDLKTMKAALASANQTKEVLDAKKKVEYIETLPVEEKREKMKEMTDVAKVIEKEVKPEIITENRAKYLIGKYRELGNKK